MEEPTTEMERFTLRVGQWYAAELIGDEFHAQLRSYSPIKVRSIRQLKSGNRMFELGFYHANYPEGVQNKVYLLRTIERAHHFLLTQRTDQLPFRYLLIY